VVRKLERQAASSRALLKLPTLEEPALVADGYPCLHARHRDLALCCLPRSSPPRRFALWLISLSQFDTAMLSLIVCSSLLIAFEPLTEERRENTPAWLLEGMSLFVCNHCLYAIIVCV
jgi:hypothetical protein